MIEQALYQKLIEVARARETTFYSDAGRLVGLDMTIPHDRVVLGEMLDQISMHEHDEGRPLLSAVVVQKRGRQPSGGFFDCAREVGRQWAIDNEGFWRAELARVHDYWSRH